MTEIFSVATPDETTGKDTAFSLVGSFRNKLINEYENIYLFYSGDCYFNIIFIYIYKCIHISVKIDISIFTFDTLMSRALSCLLLSRPSHS